MAVCVALFSITAFATDYTWSGGGDDHGWRTPANWGQATKYPGSGDRAIFPADCTAEVEIGATDNYDTVKYLRVMNNANVRFYASDPSALTRFDLKDSWDFSSYTNITVEFDHIQVNGGKALTIGSGATLTAKNGAELQLGAFTVNSGASGVTLLSGSKMSVSSFTVKTAPSFTLTIDDSTVTASSNVYLGDTAPGGGRFVFKGRHPIFKVTGNPYFKCNHNNADMISHFDFDFVVPEGGFAEVPLQHVGSQAFRDSGNVPADYIRFNVLSTSPALSAGTQTDCPLFFSVQNGIVRAKVTNGDPTTAALRFADMAGATEAASDGEAKALYATIGSGSPAPTPAAQGGLSTYTKTVLARHAITAYGYATALATGGDTTSIELWCGTANNAASMSLVDTLTPAALGEFSVVFHEAEYTGDTTCYFQWRLFDTDGTGATNNAVESAIFSNTIVDSTGYTWTGRGGDGCWTNAVNWRGDQNGDCYGYPQSTASTATFPDLGGEYTVEVPCDLSVSKMTFNSNLVTLKGVGGSRPKITLSNNSVFTALTLDNVEIYRYADHTFGAGTYLHLKNGAYVTVNNFTMTAAGGTVLLHLEGGSTFSSTQAYIGGGNKIIIDDSEYLLKNSAFLGSSSADCTIVFKGVNPKLTVNGSYAFQSGLDSSNATLEFHIPAGGYGAAPITTTTGNNNVFANNTSKTGTITFDVVTAEGDGTGEIYQPLVVWTKGFNTTRTLLGSLPSGANSASFALADTTSEQVWSDASALTSSAKSLGVHITGPADVFSWTDYTAPDGTWSAIADGNGNVAFTFTDGDHAKFRYWADAAGHPISAAQAFALPVDEAAGVAPVFYNVWHVAADGDDANGGTSPTDAKATLAAGYTLLSNAYDTLLVHDGTYTNVANFVVTNNWRIVSEHGAASTAILAPEGERFASFQIGVSDGNKTPGEVRGFTFAPANGVRQSHSAAVIDKGVLADCVVTNLGTISGTDNQTIVWTHTSDSIVSNCQFFSCQGHGATAAVIQQYTQGKVFDCTFIDCAGAMGRYGGTISVGNAGSIVRDCLFLNCTNTSTGGAISFYGGGLVENCTIIGCQATGSSTIGGGVGVFSNPGTLRNCIVYGCSNKAGDANISGDVTVEYTATSPLFAGPGNILLGAMPDFADLENGDCRVLSGATIDAGLYRDWMDGAWDLAGTNRIIGAAVDMGCYESVPQGLRATIQASSTAELGAGSEIMLSAVVTAADMTGLTYAWTVTDKSGATVFTASGADCASVTHAYGIGFYSVSLTVANAAQERYTTQAEDLFCVKPETVWVKNGASETFPYDTTANGFTNIVAAVAFAESGMTIRMADGIYTNMDEDVTLSRAITVVGEHGADAATYFTTKKLTLNHAAARVCGLTLMSDYGTSSDNIHLTMGALDSCVVTNYNHGNATLSCDAGGLITNCLVIGCRNYARDCFIDIDEGQMIDSKVIRNQTTGGTYNALVRVKSGLLRGCLIADNETSAGEVNYMSGFAVSLESNGTVESCTVANNSDTCSVRNPAVGAWVNSGTIVNCVIAGNRNLDGPVGVGNAGHDKYGAALATYTLSDVAGLTGTGCITGDPIFNNAAVGDYRLKAGSPARRAGMVLPWMVDALDLNGNPRLSGKTVDMGCYEHANTSLSIFLR